MEFLLFIIDIMKKDFFFIFPNVFIIVSCVYSCIPQAHRVMIHAPLGLPHRTKEDVSLEGYHIPKVIMN